MPRLPAKQREAEKISTQLPNLSYAAAAHDTPSRNSFESHANALLANLPGDKTARKQVLSTFISSLKSKREEFRREKKTGAGLATEAIDFYKYALEKNAKLKGDGGNNSTPMKDGVNENGNDDNCNDGDRCRVCNRGGNLIHCSQSVCSNSFHFDCILPVPEEEITKDWNCAFCDAAYITGMKPQTKKRRLAVIAVKEMEQIRADLDSGKVSPSKRKVDDLDDETSPSRSKRQRRARKHRIDDDDDEDEPNKKSQQRQQQELPILNKDEIPVEILRRLAPKSINSNSKHGQFHCKFCMDDDNTATCCFCACRVCFSKHDRSSTMLCDICDAEYHMNCLSPPLSSLPSTDWFCPTCVKVITDSDNLVKKIPTATTKGKSPNKVGRPPKAKSAKTNNNQSLLKANFASKQPRDNSGRFASKTSSPQPDQPVKRGPGRPPKNLSKLKVLTPMPVPSIKTGTGRPRGRPPKNKKAIVVTANGGQGSALKSLRSSSKVNPPKKTGTGRPRGRPPKNLKLNNVGKNHKSSLQVKTSPHEEAYSDLESQSTSQNATYDKFDDESDVHMFAEAHNNANIRSNTLNPAPSFIPEITMKTNEETSVSIDEFERAKAAAMGVFTGNTKSMIESSKRSKSSNGDIKQVQKVPRRKPGARECLQISRRFGANIIPQQYMETLLDYCTRGKVEHLIRMRERLDEHARFLELQLSGLEMMIQEKGGREPEPTNEITDIQSLQEDASKA